MNAPPSPRVARRVASRCAAARCAAARRVAVGLAGVAALWGATEGAALAQSPATQPIPQSDAQTAKPAPGPATLPAVRPSPFGNRILRLRDIGGLAAPRPRDESDLQVRPIDDDEWQRITEFARENFPNRWRQFEAVRTQRGADSPLVETLRVRIAVRFRTLERIQGHLPDLYDAAVKQGRLEDDAWGATADIRRDPKNPLLAKKLREKVSALVKNVLDERQARLDTLRETLRDDQNQLETDVKDLDKLVDEQVKRLTGDAPMDSGFVDRDGRRMGGGFGGMGGRIDAPRWDGPTRSERRRGMNDSREATTQPEAVTQ